MLVVVHNSLRHVTSSVLPSPFFRLTVVASEGLCAVDIITTALVSYHTMTAKLLSCRKL